MLGFWVEQGFIFFRRGARGPLLERLMFRIACVYSKNAFPPIFNAEKIRRILCYRIEMVRHPAMD